MKNQKIFFRDYNNEALRLKIHEDRDALQKESNEYRRQEIQIDIQLSLSELQIRSDRRLSRLAIGISVISLIATLCFEYNNGKSNQVWQQQELQELRAINNSILGK